MKKITILLCGLIFTIASNAGMIYVSVNATDNSKSGKVTFADVLNKSDAKTFLALKPEKIFELTGKSLSLGQKISLKMAQVRVKRQLKKGKAIDMAAVGKEVSTGVNVLWVLVGMLVFWPLGLILAYATRKGPEDNRVKSAWIGTGILFVILIILIAAEGFPTGY